MRSLSLGSKLFPARSMRQGNTAKYMRTEAQSKLLAPNLDRSLRVIALKLNCTVDVFLREDLTT